MEIQANNCQCHVETCNCWNWYVMHNGKPLFGSDNRESLEETVKELKEALNE